jgi:hypothetical protein
MILVTIRRLCWVLVALAVVAGGMVTTPRGLPVRSSGPPLTSASSIPATSSATQSSSTVTRWERGRSRHS